jgi:hypothetical protein
MRTSIPVTFVHTSFMFLRPWSTLLGPVEASRFISIAWQDVIQPGKWPLSRPSRISWGLCSDISAKLLQAQASHRGKIYVKGKGAMATNCVGRQSLKEDTGRSKSKTFDDNLVVEFKEPPFSPSTLQKGKYKGQRPSRKHPRLPTTINMDGSLQHHVPPKSNGTHTESPKNGGHAQPTIVRTILRRNSCQG